MIDLAPHHLETVKRILAEHLPDSEVRAFGSRATWTAWEYSDLDLAVVSPEPLDWDRRARLREAFEESDLPIRVDIVDWESLSDGFRQTIVGDCVVLQEGDTSRDWREYSIGDIAQVVGGGTPSTKDPANFGGDIPWLTPKDLSGPHDRYVSRGTRSLSQQGLDGSSAKLLPSNSVLLSTRAPIGYVAIAKNPISTNQGFRSLIANENCDPQYLYYWLTHNTEELERHASGSTFRELSGTSLKGIRLQLPPLHEQRRIARILGALDDKIELNRRMSQTLEAMAQALFKSWFIDFDPVRAKAEGRPTNLPPYLDQLFPDTYQDSELGLVPEGWKAGTLGAVIEVNPRRTIKRGQTATHVEMAALPTSGPQVTKWTHRVFTSGSRFTRGDTLLARITPSLENGKTAFVDFLDEGETGWGSTEFIVLRPKEPWPPAFGYLLARDPNFREHAIVNMTGTSGRQRVPPEAVASYLTPNPPTSVVSAFGKLVHSCFQEGTHLSNQSLFLAALRDILILHLFTDASQKGRFNERAL